MTDEFLFYAVWLACICGAFAALFPEVLTMFLQVIHRERGHETAVHEFCEACGREACAQHGWSVDGAHVIRTGKRASVVVRWLPGEAPTHCDGHNPMEIQ